MTLAKGIWIQPRRCRVFHRLIPMGADYLKEVSLDSKNQITPTRFATLSNDEKNDRD
jgi:hypothetical protein